jgi:hypothetical protein
MFLALFKVIVCTFLIIHIFDSFSKYFRSYNVSQFPCFSVFLDIFQFLTCEFLIFVFQYSRHMSCPTVYLYHFSRFSVFLAIFQFLLCWDSLFPQLSVFSPYPRTYSVCFTFSTFFSVSRHIPCPNVYVSHFPGFITFLDIFQVLECTFIFFHVFQCFSPYSSSYHVNFSFSFVSILPIYHVLQCTFIIFLVSQCFSPYSSSYHVRFSFS